MEQKQTDIRNQVLFIRAGDGFIPKGIKMEGFSVEKPYYEGGLLLRILREAWFRLKIPFKSIWYNKQVKKFQGEHLIIFDPQITADYLTWLKKQNRWTISFVYGNMVGRARHLTPPEIPEGIQCWTYEKKDSQTYGIKLNERKVYYSSYCREKQPEKYDVLFVGRDKGRLTYISELEQKLNEIGLKTFFRIIGDTRFEKRKDRRYGTEMPYEEICDLIACSKAILNVALPGQEGLTMRDFEAICNNVKLITTNKKIVEQSFYNPNNILAIDEIDAEEIKRFLDIPLIPYSEETRNSFCLEAWVQELIEERVE